MPGKQESQRDPRIDRVKAAAICLVLVNHVTVPAFAMGGVGSPAWLCALALAALSHTGVPLFLMASGALLLAPERDVSLKRLYTERIPRILASSLFWAVCYKFFGFWLDGGMTRSAVVYALKEVLLFRHEQHLYYLHIMLLVYALLPLTRLAAECRERGTRAYLLALWFLLGIAYPTLRPCWPFTLLRGIPVQWMMNMTYASVGYTLLGYCLARRRPARRGVWAALVGTGLILCFFSSWAASAAAGRLDTRFLEGMSVPVCLSAAGLFGLWMSGARPGALGRAAEFLSRASFCIFLTHIIFLKSFARLGFTAQIGPTVLTVPLVAGAILLCCCALYALLRRVPIVNRWLI